MSKARQIAILVLGLIAAFCEWGISSIVTAVLWILEGSVPVKVTSQTAGIEFWAMAIGEFLYLFFLVTLGLWVHTRLFYRLRWVVLSILGLQGINRFLNTLQTPWSFYYHSRYLPLKVLGLGEALLVFLIAYLVVSTKRTPSRRAQGH